MDSPGELRAAARDADRIPADGYAGATVRDLVRGWASHSPDEVAVDWPGEQLTYRRLFRAAGNISDALHAAGVDEGRSVVVRLRPAPTSSPP